MRLSAAGLCGALALGGALSACSGCASYRRCSAPSPAQLSALPASLSETGLFAAGPPAVLGRGVRAYAPAHASWSDGASKRRWLYLPEGSRIDTTDPDDWVFPVGSKFWKEFSLGQRVETRLLVKVGPGEGDWAGAAYLWDADQREARLAPEGRKDSAGTGYEVPSAAQCAGCHGGRRSHVLGFSALQLAPAELPLSLEVLESEGLLTRPLAHPPGIPGDERQQAALGYLHANCGHCHNSARPARGDGPRCYDPQRSLDFWLPSEPAGPPGVLRTAVPRYLTPGEPEDSRLLLLVSRRGSRLHMPPLGSQRVDEEGVRLLTEWIESLGHGNEPSAAVSPALGSHADTRSAP
jgi:hypothetical protein